jgi:hypothetical protein
MLEGMKDWHIYSTTWNNGRWIGSFIHLMWLTITGLVPTMSIMIIPMNRVLASGLARGLARGQARPVASSILIHT